jgi:hypothetical protein
MNQTVRAAGPIGVLGFSLWSKLPDLGLRNPFPKLQSVQKIHHQFLPSNIQAASSLSRRPQQETVNLCLNLQLNSIKRQQPKMIEKTTKLTMRSPQIIRRTSLRLMSSGSPWSILKKGKRRKIMVTLSDQKKLRWLLALSTFASCATVSQKQSVDT